MRGQSSKGSPFPFCYLLKFKISATILTTFLGFSLLGIFFLLIALFNSIEIFLTLFTIFLFLVLSASYKSYNKNDGFWYLTYSLNISVFISDSLHIIFFQKSVNLNFFVKSKSDSGSNSRFFFGNILLLKLLRIISLALKSNPAFFRKKIFFQLAFHLTQYLFLVFISIS